MITLDLIPCSEQAIDLETDRRLTRGTSSGKERLSGRITVSEPAVLPITPDLVKDDPELTSFLQINQGLYRFFLLYLNCTFYPAEGEPFENAWLKVQLAGQSQGDAKRPVVWSMRPENQIKNIQISATVKLGGSLKFIDTGLDTGGEVQKTWSQEKAFIRAYSIEPEPFWEFNAVEGAEIGGNYHLSMIVRQDQNAAGAGKIELRATIRRKKLGLLPYKADFPTSAQASIRFS